LVAVEGEEAVDLAVGPAREDPPAAHPLAAGLLDLDDVGTEVAEDLGGQRSLQQLGEVQHPHTCEGAGCVSDGRHETSMESRTRSSRSRSAVMRSRRSV